MCGVEISLPKQPTSEYPASSHIISTMEGRPLLILSCSYSSLRIAIVANSSTRYYAGYDKPRCSSCRRRWQCQRSACRTNSITDQQGSWLMSTARCSGSAALGGTRCPSSQVYGVCERWGVLHIDVSPKMRTVPVRELGSQFAN